MATFDDLKMKITAESAIQEMNFASAPLSEFVHNYSELEGRRGEAIVIPDFSNLDEAGEFNPDSNNYFSGTNEVESQTVTLDKLFVKSLMFTDRDFGDTEAIAPEIWQCINPFFVIVLTPIIMIVFGALAKRGKEISTPKKIAFGMFITACAYLFLIAISMVNNYPSGEEFKGLSEAMKASMKAGPWVLIVTYFFLTVAELFISPLGLSFVSKIAPQHLQGICQGLWLCATAIGNLFIALGVTMLNSFPHQWECWAVFAGFCLLSMGVMLGMLKWLERVTQK